MASTYTMAEGETTDNETGEASANNQPPVKRAPLRSRETQLSALAQQYQQSGETLWLETSDGPFLSLFLKEASGLPQGGIIIIPDENTSPDWPKVTRPLRQRLPLYGWYTLAIALPDRIERVIPKRTLPVLSAVKPTNGDASNNSTDTETASSDGSSDSVTTIQNQADDKAETDLKQQQEIYTEKVFKRTEAASKRILKQGQDRIVVLGIGTGGYWATRFVHQYQGTMDLKLLLVDAREPTDIKQGELNELLRKVKVTTLDLYHGNRPAMTRSEILADKRLRNARHYLMNNFHQHRMPILPDNWKSRDQRLVRQVRGMLNTYVIKAEEKSRRLTVNPAVDPSAELQPGSVPAPANKQPEAI